jgi:hypothetical protein
MHQLRHHVDDELDLYQMIDRQQRVRRQFLFQVYLDDKEMNHRDVPLHFLDAPVRLHQLDRQVLAEQNQDVIDQGVHLTSVDVLMVGVHLDAMDDVQVDVELLRLQLMRMDCCLRVVDVALQRMDLQQVELEQLMQQVHLRLALPVQQELRAQLELQLLG